MQRTIAFSAVVAAAPLPPAPRWVSGKAVDVIGEMAVADPYRGLENAADPAGRAWSDAENSRTRTFLGASEAERHINQGVYRHRIGEPAVRTYWFSRARMACHERANSSCRRRAERLRSHRSNSATAAVGSSSCCAAGNEPHGYRAMEPIQETLWQMTDWLDRYVKPMRPAQAVAK